METVTKATENIDPVVKEMDNNVENLKGELDKIKGKTIEKMEEMFSGVQWALNLLFFWTVTSIHRHHFVINKHQFGNCYNRLQYDFSNNLKFLKAFSN